MQDEDESALDAERRSDVAPRQAPDWPEAATGAAEALSGLANAMISDVAAGNGLPAVPVRRYSLLRLLVRDLVQTVILAALVFAGLRVAVQNTVVQGDSMLPNFADGQRLLVNKLAFRFQSPRRGDVIVFHAPGGYHRDFIKRVVALPGERVEIRDGTVYIDGQPIAEPWQPIRDHTAFPEYEVPSGQVFVLGDNRPNSNDSRTWGGGLPLTGVVGEVWLSIWPPERWGLVPQPAADGAAGSDES